MSEDSLILEHIKTHGYISPAEAFSLYGCAALHSSASRLRKRGHNIICKMQSGNGKRWGHYYLLPVAAREAA